MAGTTYNVKRELDGVIIEHLSVARHSHCLAKGTMLSPEASISCSRIARYQQTQSCEAESVTFVSFGAWEAGETSSWKTYRMKTDNVMSLTQLQRQREPVPHLP